MRAEDGWACFSAPPVTEYNLPLQYDGQLWRKAYYQFTVAEQNDARKWCRGEDAHGVKHSAPPPPSILIPRQDWREANEDD